MNTIKLQDTNTTYRNQLCFYILTMNYVKKDKKKTILFITASKTIKNL